MNELVNPSWDPIDAVPEDRRELIASYGEELDAWNCRLNLVSQASIATWLDTHVRHCLTIAHKRFPDGSTVVDWGTGGGLPAIPLAIAFPDVQFVAVDSKAKKVAALREITRALALDNVEIWNGRAEDWDGSAYAAVSRATAPLKNLWKWSERVLQPVDFPSGDVWPSGLLCLKGGDLAKEIRQLRRASVVGEIALDSMTGMEVFANKYLLLVTGDERG